MISNFKYGRSRQPLIYAAATDAQINVCGADGAMFLHNEPNIARRFSRPYFPLCFPTTLCASTFEAFEGSARLLHSSGNDAASSVKITRERQRIVPSLFVASARDNSRCARISRDIPRRKRVGKVRDSIAVDDPRSLRRQIWRVRNNVSTEK